MTKGITYSSKIKQWIYYDHHDTKDKEDEMKYFSTEKEAQEYAKTRKSG